MKIAEIFEADLNLSALLQGIDLTSFETFMESLKWRVPRERVQQLQLLMDQLRQESERPGPGWIKLYHGSPHDKKIRDTGFELTQGERSLGFMGANYSVQNQGIFLTDNKQVAYYFGSNRTTGHASDYGIIASWVDVSHVLDVQNISRDQIRLGLQLINAYNGSKLRKIPQREWWWLLDRPEFIEPLKAQYTGIRFREATPIEKTAGAGFTYMIFDPRTIRIENRDTISGIKKFYEWLRRSDPRAGENETARVQGAA